MCTSFRWMGNAKGRFKEKDEREMRDSRRLAERKLNDGLIVQREDTALAWRRSGFDPRLVH